MQRNWIWCRWGDDDSSFAAGARRIEFANTLEVWVGGGEYNVAYALSRLGLRTGWAARMVDNPSGTWCSITRGRWASMCRR